MQVSLKPWQVSCWSATWVAMSNAERKRFGCLLLVHLLLSLLFISRQGVLFDEPDYYKYAWQWLSGHPLRNEALMDSKTPMMLPSLVSLVLKPFLPAHYLQQDFFFYLRLGRPFMYVYQAFGMYAVCCWLYRVCGANKWFLPLLLYSFDPLIFSYSMVIGSDLASASLLVATMYAAWRFTVTGSRRYFIIMSVGAAIAVVTKVSMMYAYPMLAVLLLFNYKQLHVSFQSVLSGTAVFMVIQLLTINIAYYGYGCFTRVNQLPLLSIRFNELRSALSAIGWLPVPLPIPFLQSIDMLQQHAEIGGCLAESTYGGVDIFNQHVCNQSIWYYYVATALFKLPLLTWLFIVAAIIAFVSAKKKAVILKGNAFVWLPLFYFLLILSFTNKFQIGIRHAIILMPFLFIAIAPVVNRFYKQRKQLFLLLAALHLISVGLYIPNLIAYTNELVWNKTSAYHLIRDSSIDYGQARPLIKEFITKHPEYLEPTNIPAAGKFIISIGDLYAERDGEAKNIAWIRNNFNAVDHYQYSLLLFDISEADLKAKGLR